MPKHPKVCFCRSFSEPWKVNNMMHFFRREERIQESGPPSFSESWEPHDRWNLKPNFPQKKTVAKRRRLHRFIYVIPSRFEVWGSLWDSSASSEAIWNSECRDPKDNKRSSSAQTHLWTALVKWMFLLLFFNKQCPIHVDFIRPSCLDFQLSGRQVSDKSSPWTGNMRQDMSPAQRHADHRTRTTWADTVVLVQKRSGKEWSDQCSGLLRLPQVIYPKQTPSVAKTATFATFKNVWEKCGLSLLTMQNLWGVVPGSKYLWVSFCSTAND